MGLGRQHCSYRTLSLNKSTCCADDRHNSPNNDPNNNPITGFYPNWVTVVIAWAGRRVVRCLCVTTRHAVEGGRLCYVNLLVRTLRCRNSYTDPVFLLGHSLTQLGCEHVSRFRRACHITFSVASSSIYAYAWTAESCIPYTNLLTLTHRRLPWF